MHEKEEEEWRCMRRRDFVMFFFIVLWEFFLKLSP